MGLLCASSCTKNGEKIEAQIVPVLLYALNGRLQLDASNIVPLSTVSPVGVAREFRSGVEGVRERSRTSSIELVEGVKQNEKRTRTPWSFIRPSPASKVQPIKG